MKNTNDMVRRPDAAPVRAGSNWAAIAKTADANPMLILPEPVRAAVGKLWMCNSHLFPSGLPLCSTIRVYLDAGTLEHTDIDALVDRLLTPEHRRRHKFASDLLTDLADLLLVIPAERKKAERAMAQSDAMRRWEAEAVAGVRLGEMFKPE